MMLTYKGYKRFEKQAEVTLRKSKEMIDVLKLDTVFAQQHWYWISDIEQMCVAVRRALRDLKDQTDFAFTIDALDESHYDVPTGARASFMRLNEMIKTTESELGVTL